MKKFLKRFFISLGVIILMIALNFFRTKKADHALLELSEYFTPAYNQRSAYLLPTQFLDGERFYLKMAVNMGDTLLAYCDTGGGLSMIFPTTLENENLISMKKTGLLKGVMPVDYLLFKDLVKDERIPPPFPLRNFVIRHPFSNVTDPLLIVPPLDNETKNIQESMPGIEAFLGQNFFMGKAWTIDYLQQQVWVNTPVFVSETGNPNVQKLGFKKNSKKVNIFAHPSMQIEIDGVIIDVLFDTGATMVLSEEGKKQFNTQNKTIGGSFIAASLFDTWRKKHPEWKYFQKVDMNKDVIEVPTIKIGTLEIGPVLFAKRADKNWSEGMIHSMDKVVKGAIGGSALKYLKVTIDYNSELIKFEK